MKVPALERTSAAKAGWLIALIFAAWLVFLLVPGPKPAIKPVAKMEPIPSSRLLAVGLPDNPDLDALPQIFAIWADKADWVNDRTEFAYWNPGAMDYSYFFEATRDGGRVRFRNLVKPTFFDRKELGRGVAPPDEHPLKFLQAPRQPVYIGPARGLSWRIGDAKTGNAVPAQVPLTLPGADIKPASPPLEVVEPVPGDPHK